MSQWGSLGVGNGQLSLPWDLVVDRDNNILVVEYDNHRVQKFTKTGVFLDQWGTYGTGDGQLKYPTAIALDAAGDVYVADTDNHRIAKFTAAGNHLANWTSQDFGTGQFWFPMGLTFDAAGNLIVSDSANDRLQMLAPTPAVTQVSDVQGDQGRQVRLRFLRSGLDVADSPRPVLRYDIYRRIGAQIAGPVDKAAGWEQVGSVTARADAEYSAVVPTLVNAATAAIEYSAFFVSAVTAVPSVYSDSRVVAGYSIDNLSPPAPSAFKAAYAGGVTRLHWHPGVASDFASFRLYRGGSAGFSPDAGSFVTALTDTSYVDSGEMGRWYQVCAVDFDGNVSPFAVVGPGQTSGTDTPQISVARLYPNQPNPFNPQTVIRFDLPQAGRVRLDVYDVRGALVRTLVDAELAAGSRQVTWDGRDDAGRNVSSGSYVARFAAVGLVASERMTLVR